MRLKLIAASASLVKRVEHIKDFLIVYRDLYQFNFTRVWSAACTRSFTKLLIASCCECKRKLSGD